jgi:hypothetical protein
MPPAKKNPADTQLARDNLRGSDRHTKGTSPQPTMRLNINTAESKRKIAPIHWTGRLSLMVEVSFFYHHNIGATRRRAVCIACAACAASARPHAWQQKLEHKINQ